MNNQELEEMAKKIKEGSASAEEQTAFYEAFDQLIKSTEAILKKSE